MIKKLAALTLVLIFISVFTICKAEAGSKQRYMWSGAGIAFGAMALGGILAHHVYIHRQPSPVIIHYPPPPPMPRHSYYPPPTRLEYIPGHWEIIREWVPGKWEKVWVPGHYDKWGNWVESHYEEKLTPGYYIEKRVWVEGYYRNF